MKERSLADIRLRSHPWHGVNPGMDVPDLLTAYIEIVPTDVMKYEMDKESGILRLDRPNKFSSQCPTLYGFIPQTYCGDGIGRFAGERSAKGKLEGDGDPLDICILSERPVQHGDILVQAKPIGGLRLIDREQADDKIIPVLSQDGAYGAWQDIQDCPELIIQRLQHYFLTYKQMPSEPERRVEIAGIYGRSEALQVVKLSLQDYNSKFLSS